MATVETIANRCGAMINRKLGPIRAYFVPNCAIVTSGQLGTKIGDAAVLKYKVWGCPLRGKTGDHFLEKLLDPLGGPTTCP